MSLSSTSSIALISLPVPGERAMAPVTVMSPEASDHLLRRLASALESAAIAYCQWKGVWRPGSDGDIDLLVDSCAAFSFRSLVQQLGFRAVLPSGERQIPGLESFLGFEPGSPRPLHLHVHYRLVLGDYWRTVYRLPIEQTLLESTQAGELFRLPAPTYQFLVYVLRMMLRLRGWPLPVREAMWLAGIQGQLDYLEARSDRDLLSAILARRLPTLDVRFLDRCVHALRREVDPAESAVIRRELHRRLSAHARLPSLPALLAAVGEKVLPDPLRSMLSNGRMRSSLGGIVVALVGGDGAGKSTCARELCSWLRSDMPTLHAHLGRPPRSFLTLAVGGGLKLQQRWYRTRGRPTPTGSHLELLRHLCTARDRYRLYRRARRFAVGGGIAICERYPVPQDRVLVGPCIPELLGPAPKPVAQRMRDAEAWYYNSILEPDLLLVLQLHPDIAVARKLDEPADYVRERTRIIWETDWSGTAAQVVDVSRPLDTVVQDLKARLWAAL